MRAVLLLALVSCTKPVDQIFIYPDLSEALPDLDPTTTPDLAKPTDMAVPMMDLLDGDFSAPPDLRLGADLSPTCGLANQPCCPNGFGFNTVCSDSTLTCYAGSCSACGHDGQACCGGVMSGAGNTYCAPSGPILNCWGGTCQQCGSFQQPCCGGDPGADAGHPSVDTHEGGQCYVGSCSASGAYPYYYCL